ncbi:hypothetical protein D3C81_1892380 [compost metagenome]
MRVRAATSTTATMNTIARSLRPIQRSPNHAAMQAMTVASTAVDASLLQPSGGSDKPIRRAFARACGVLMMVIS